MQAQSRATVSGPKELPPTSFGGQQYVDSRGCVFLRAGYGGQTTWVPRVDAQRQALCGFPPSLAKVNIEVAEAPPAPRAVAPTPAPVVRSDAVDPAIYTPAPYTSPVRKTGAPTPPSPVAATRATVPAPYAATAPRKTYEAAATGPGPGKIGCFTSAPVAEVVRLTNGGTVVVCTKGDGGLAGWRSPIYPAGSPPGVALTDPVKQAPVARAAQDPLRGAVTQPKVQVATVPTPPKGYKLAWNDDRLNPQRAQGTAAGQAAQDQIWTRDVPAKLVADINGTRRVVLSTKSAPGQPSTQ